MEIHGPRQPYIELMGWVKIWIKPHHVDGKPLLDTRLGMVKWEPI